MKRYYYFLLILLNCSVSHAAEKKKHIKTIPINYINELIYKGAGSISIEQGEPMQLTIEGNQRVVDDTKITLLQGTLKINPRTHLYGVREIGFLHFTLRVKDLSKILLRGCVKATIPSINTQNLTLDLVGTPQITMNIRGDKLIVIGKGDPSIKVSGKLDRQVIELQGTGKYLAKDLNVRETDMIIIGNGTASVQAGEELSVLINGSGEVTYTGTPKEFSEKISGNGSITKSNG